MNGLEQAFIDAYRTTSVEVNPQVGVPPAGQGKTANAGRTWSRIDTGVASVSKPHRPMKPPVSPPPQTYSIEVSTWDASLPAAAAPACVAADVVAWGPAPPTSTDGGGQVQSAASGQVAETNEEPVASVPAVRPIEPTAPVQQTSAEMPVDDRAAADATFPPFKPVWEVDRFVWPSESEAIYAAESSYFAHAGQKLREAAREGLHVLAIVSSHPGEGCTTLAICLARAAAESGIRVALMDANVHSPQVGQRMGVKFPHSWTDAVAGDIPLGETSIASVERPITLLPLALSCPREGSLSDPRIVSLIRAVASAVDLVIIDLGTAIEEASECFVAASRCPFDAAIVVRDIRRTAEAETLQAAERLRDLGVNAIGIAENYSPRPAAEQAAA